ncbi:MAG: hypothetical protein GWO79_00170 [Actinobacteria bacterium]|nr:hypothetical protein [Actinomycetota bacterium]
MKKNWRVLPEISKDFIKKYPDLSRVVLQLLFNRGITGRDEIEEFLSPTNKSPQPPFTKGGNNNYDPFLFKDMGRAVDLVIEHIKKQNKIVIYGDYDADGVTATAVLLDTIGTLKAKVEPYIPDRVSEGYGLNREAVKELSGAGVKLIIMVDGGIRSKEEIEYAKGLGLDVIVTDHHVPPSDTPPTPFVKGALKNPPNPPLLKGGVKSELPDCLVINPLVEGENYPFKYLAGVGVAFKLAKAIISKSKLSDGDKDKLEERILDLAAIGTVADCVTLLGENRTLVKRGLDVLNNTKRIGLQELIKIAQINGNKKLDSWNIGFQIAPRINAAGRMDHANTALELLITKDKEEAEAIARRLNDRNIERQGTTEDIVERIIAEVEERILKQQTEFSQIKNTGRGSLTSGITAVLDGRGAAGLETLPPAAGRGAPSATELLLDKIIIAVTPEDEVWNEGVVGLAAGRISNKYYLPTLVITKNEDGYKGSGRSIDEFNIMEVLEECSELLDKYGGHPMACGFSIKKENLEKFKKKIIEIAGRKLKDINLMPKIDIETEIGLNEVDEEFIAEVEKFAPFGQNNNQPKFMSREVSIVDITTMGIDGKHIKLRMTNDECLIAVNAIGFGQAEQWKDLRIGDKVDIVYYVEMNEFNGRSDVQLKIVDIKLCEN